MAYGIGTCIEREPCGSIGDLCIRRWEHCADSCASLSCFRLLPGIGHMVTQSFFASASCPLCVLDCSRILFCPLRARKTGKHCRAQGLRTVLTGSEKEDSVPLAIGAGWFGAYLAALDTRLDRHCSHVIYASAATSHTHASTKSLLDSAQYTESTTDPCEDSCVIVRF